MLPQNEVLSGFPVLLLCLHYNQLLLAFNRLMRNSYAPGAVEEMVASFVRTWNSYSPDSLEMGDFAIERVVPIEAGRSSFWLVDHYWPGRSQVTAMFDALLFSAQEELWMIQGYAFLTPALVQRIALAVERGVKVHVVLSDFARKANYEKAALYGILDLIEAGARVYIYRNPLGAFLHLKLIVADGRLSAFGSANYNLRSQTLSREVAAVFDDAAVGELAMDHIQQLISFTREVSREEARTYRNFGSFLYYLLMQVWG